MNFRRRPSMRQALAFIYPHIKTSASGKEPDHDDPVPQVYAAREQIEGWLRSASDRQQTLIVFWE